MSDFIKNNAQALTLIFFMLLAIAATFLVQGTKKPAKLRRRVSRALRSYAGLRRFAVLDNITFELRGKPCTADHVMVGFFGVLFVGDLVLKGDYYGELDGETWVCNTPAKEDDFAVRVGAEPNPLLSGRACMEAARDLCARSGIYSLQMDCIAVNAHSKGMFLVTGGKDCTFNLRTLRGYLQRSWFSQDNGVDVQKVVRALTGGQA